VDLDSFLQEISEKDGVSGFEDSIASCISKAFHSYVDDTRTDNLGNLIFYKKGASSRAPKILLCAHMDEIGLMVTKIEENGFLRFSSLGGFDVRTLPGQDVVIYGKKPLNGIIGFKPPHLEKEKEKRQSIKMENLFIDTGLPRAEVEETIKVGAIAALKRRYLTLLNNCRAGKAFDDRAGVAVLWQCVRELSRMDHEADLYLVCTVQEEVGVRGAVISTYNISPDLGIAVDVCHGDFPGSLEHEVSPLGKGPVITVGPNIHPFLADALFKTAEEYGIPHQRDVSPGPTGTDARAIQVTRGGIPAALVSVPLRYMHTSVELLNLEDIKAAGRLLAYFVSDLRGSFVEGLMCL